MGGMTDLSNLIAPEDKIGKNDLPDHAAASADLLELYAKRLRANESPADWPEFPLVMRIIARRL